MKYIMLDTNVLIYREGEKEVDNKIQTLLSLITEINEYSFLVHPLSIKELSKHKNEVQRDVILSKVKIYKELDNPPEITDDFNNMCGCHNNHDYIDNSLLFAIHQECANYLISNDSGLLKKARKIGLSDKVLSPQEALDLFYKAPEGEIYRPIIVEEEYLYRLDPNDSFFDSLKEDYKGFSEWFSGKRREHKKGYISKLDNGNLGSILIMKVENENEQYNDFDEPFTPKKRVKVSTFKVCDTGRGLGESYIKIIFDYAIKEKVEEIYVTIFDKQERLIHLFEEYGFKLFTRKNTKKSDGTIEKEGVYVRTLDFSQNVYPEIVISNQNSYFVPIKDEYTRMLFPDLFLYQQISIDDYEYDSQYNTGIKKIYICNSPIQRLQSGDILFFYSSQIKKAIMCYGVIEQVFRANEINDYLTFKGIIYKRTVYKEEYLKEAFENNYLVIMFKFYSGLKKPLTFDMLKDENIIKGAIQSIQSINPPNVKKIVELSGIESRFKI